MNIIVDVFYDTYIDALRLLPFLFLAYLAMECLEHWTGGRMKEIVRKSGKMTGNRRPSRYFSAMRFFRRCGKSLCRKDYYNGHSHSRVFIHV